MGALEGKEACTQSQRCLYSLEHTDSAPITRQAPSCCSVPSPTLTASLHPCLSPAAACLPWSPATNVPALIKVAARERYAPRRLAVQFAKKRQEAERNEKECIYYMFVFIIMYMH